MIHSEWRSLILHIKLSGIIEYKTRNQKHNLENDESRKLVLPFQPSDL